MLFMCARLSLADANITILAYWAYQKSEFWAGGTRKKNKRKKGGGGGEENIGRG